MFHLKLIAVITMAIDHIGLFFFPDAEVFRIIGRLSFPLFAFLIANGAYHTKNIHAYLLRLFVFAIISQVPFWLSFSLMSSGDTGLNIFFTLFLGLLAIYCITRIKNKLVWGLCVMFCASIALLLGADYGAAGVFSIVGFYLFSKRLKVLAIYQALIFLLFFTFPTLTQYIETGYMNIVGLLQPVAVVSLLFIFLYNGKEGLRAKYLFYLFYPLHLLVIYLVLKM